MTDAPFPAHMLAWKASSDVIHMEEIPVGDPSRTVQGFALDKKFNAPAPKLMFDNPYEDDADRLNKVNKYWKARDKERMQREARYKELLDAEVKATVQRKAREEEAAQEREKEQELEKEKDTEPVKEKEAGPSGNAKGKAREVPRTPRKVTPKKSQTENIPCVPQTGKKVCVACGKRKMKREFFDKTTWAILDGTKQVVEAGFVMEIEARATTDLGVVDTRLLQLLELKSKGIEITEDLENRIRVEREVIQRTLKEQLEDLTTRMDNIQKRTAWTKNGLPRFTPVVLPAAAQGTKRKGENEGDHAEGSKKKKKKKVVETEDEGSTMR
ncbi:hypothetical protein M422DRAFT_258965 [Sphaerobolus stellatus SS14]|uniref:Uncharacterized protein n=1 Tax=Sphaerobolus stellatus (strain SS14) TaxID=990650 RepID=A0A0C9UTY9_SPHS4|nr:hypothetical protein M422DRAFT_258965 [Sphaerobolus stellatus SS14]